MPLARFLVNSCTNDRSKKQECIYFWGVGRNLIELYGRGMTISYSCRSTKQKYLVTGCFIVTLIR